MNFYFSASMSPAESLAAYIHMAQSGSRATAKVANVTMAKPSAIRSSVMPVLVSILFYKRINVAIYASVSSNSEPALNEISQ